MNLDTKKCFIDLHLHLDGSLSVKTVQALCRMQGLSVPEKSQIEALTVAKDCKSLNEYLTKFDFPLSLLTQQKAIAFAVESLTCELFEKGVIYAEIRFAPQLHLKKGLTQRQVVQAAVSGIEKSPIKAALILCTMRGKDNLQANLQTVALAKEFLNKGVCAVDLAGAEGIFPTESFEDIFKKAKQLNVPFTIHAGEADGPHSIKKALDFGAKRIGHGIRCLEDEALVKRLKDENIFLELCPTSNINTGIFKDLKEYPISELLQKEIKATINSDNMSVSNTNVKNEYQKLSLTLEQVKTLLHNSADAAFTSDEEKKRLHSIIDKEI